MKKRKQEQAVKEFVIVIGFVVFCCVLLGLVGGVSCVMIRQIWGKCFFFFFLCHLSRSEKKEGASSDRPAVSDTFQVQPVLKPPPPPHQETPRSYLQARVWHRGSSDFNPTDTCALSAHGCCDTAVQPAAAAAAAAGCWATTAEDGCLHMPKHTRTDAASPH